MTPGARVGAVIDLYDMIRAAARPADQMLHDYFRARKFIGSGDRRFITETIYTILRHYARLSWWAAQLGMDEKGRNLMLLWLAFGTSEDLRGIQDLFDGAGYAPSPLSRFERELLERAVKLEFIPPEMPEAVQLECPDWAYASLKKFFGDSFRDEMLAIGREAPLDMRVNTLKAARDTVLKQLRRDDFTVHETRYSPIGLRVQGRPAFSAHPLYMKGAIEIQDEGSQLLSLLCGAKPGEWVVDFCAGAGGKTLALAAQMENKGRIWACDIEKNRLENSRKRLRRAGVHCVQMQLLDDEEDDWVRKHKGKADCVLIDAPCSGVGTWRRSPFSRWQNLGPSLKALTKVQQNILQSAARLVKPGGRLLYATCSLLPEENQDQIEQFLAGNNLFKPMPLESLAQLPGLDLSSSHVQLTPARNETDGFFISAMLRV
ncbi:MAG: putative tRNA and rRNA cytosine-C5-methylase [Alphaproteobacteria bacterium]|nr:putative tRNA and rRNA cytosine-C5-methylase [Alphaproteobacteria bacterium]